MSLRCYWFISVTILTSLLFFFISIQLEPGETYTYREPTQSPINPPYKDACELRRTDRLSKPLLDFPILNSADVDSAKSKASNDPDLELSSAKPKSSEDLAHEVSQDSNSTIISDDLISSAASKSLEKMSLQ